jgi:oxygen-independent coproporphyrinogen-3 oxidase
VLRENRLGRAPQAALPSVCYAGRRVLTMMGPIRSIYAHVPFCHTLCGYCDFYSVVYDRKAASPLVDALLRELKQASDRYAVQTETIFVGGGTPTTLPLTDLRRLLDGLSRTAANGELEFTVEANPATVTREKADVLAACKVNRLSVGAQSFDRSELRVLERIHEPDSVAETVRIAREARIAQINLDLMFGMPGQSLEGWLANLERALELGADHLSCYGLTYEPGTPLYDRLQRGAIQPADPGLEAEMYEATIARLEAAGFEHYEISNFARPGCACRHNLTYWHNEAYLGIGPSAAGYVAGVRYRNVPDHAAYVRAVAAGRSPRCEREHRTGVAAARETAMLALRLRAGIDRLQFIERHGADPRELFADAIKCHGKLGLLQADDAGIRLTRRGLLVADSVISDFL